MNKMIVKHTVLKLKDRILLKVKLIPLFFENLYAKSRRKEDSVVPKKGGWHNEDYLNQST